MNYGKLPRLFFDYAYSGKAKCKRCERLIVPGQFIFVFEGNIYHDICSKDLAGRQNIKELEELV